MLIIVPWCLSELIGTLRVSFLNIIKSQKKKRIQPSQKLTSRQDKKKNKKKKFVSRSQRDLSFGPVLDAEGADYQMVGIFII